RVITFVGEDSSREERFFDNSGNLVRLSTPEGLVTEYAYDSRGFLTGDRGPDGYPGRFFRDGNGRLTGAEYKGQTLKIERDLRGRPQKMSGCDMFVGFIWNDAGTKVSIDNESGREEFTSSGDWSRSWRGINGDEFHLMRRNGRISSAVFGGSSIEITGTTISGTEELRINGSSAAVAFYDDYGRLRRLDGSGGWEYSWSPGGKLKTYKDPEGRMGWLEYDPCGRLSGISFEGMKLLQVEYDGSGGLAGWNNGLESWRIRRNPGGTPAEIETTSGNWKIARDEKGRPGVIECSGAGSWKIVRADNGTINSVHGPAGERRFSWDSRGRIKKAISPMGRELSVSYGSDGYLTSVDYGGGNSLEYRFDGLGRIVSLIRPGGGWHSSYDAFGNLLEITTDGNSWKIRRDRLGKPLEIVGGSREIVFRYTDSGRLREKLFKHWGMEQYFSHDSAGRLTETRCGLSSQVFSLDRRGGIYRITRNGRLIDFEFDASGRVKLVRYPNGIVKRIGYDRLGRVNSERYFRGTEAVYSMSYEYDLSGRLQHRTDDYEGLSRTDSFEYASCGRPAKAWYGDGAVEEFAYDADGYLTGWNRKREKGVVYRVNRAGQVTGSALADGSGEVSFSYASSGGRESRTGKDPAEYSYDGRGFLTRVRMGNVTVEYVYDWQGNIHERRTSSPSGQTEEKFLFADRDIFETAENSSRTAWICDGRGRVYRMLGKDEFYFGQDQFGNVRLVFDRRGELVDILHYNAQGLCEKKPIIPLGWRGHYFDQVSGMYFFNGRWYDPETGSFLTAASHDPAAVRGDSAHFLLEHAFFGNYWREESVQDYLVEHDWRDLIFGNAWLQNEMPWQTAMALLFSVPAGPGEVSQRCGSGFENLTWLDFREELFPGTVVPAESRIMEQFFCDTNLELWRRSRPGVRRDDCESDMIESFLLGPRAGHLSDLCRFVNLHSPASWFDSVLSKQRERTQTPW
ncbi:MAG: hypothetical protein PHQ23_07005, partial [Candidatus Wallbacteria bacterium]|nr:hypothetical protein [Candidatus Wallbacteria bacterium]